MNEEESGQWRDRLSEVLSQYRLQWVLEQVTQNIRLGNTSEEEVPTSTETEPRPTTGTLSDLLVPVWPPARRSGRRARFVASREYSPKEMLKILIEAIERAVVDTAEMEAEMLKQFENDGTRYQIVIVRDDQVLMRLRVAPTDAISRAGSASRLRDLLRELRAQI